MDIWDFIMVSLSAAILCRYTWRLVLRTSLNDIKFTKNLEKLLEQKQQDYGGFDHTSQIMANYLSDILSIENNTTVRVPVKTFGVIMVFLKLWRVCNQRDIKLIVLTILMDIQNF